MFPLVFIYGVALKFKDRVVARYTFPLVGIGTLFALYQNFFYYFGESSSLPCDASGVSCYQRLISEFGGYISFPMFSLTIFFTTLVLILVARFYKKEII
jgi:disulfide bond formation protein DsbB